MGTGIKQRELRDEPPARRANRRLNGMADTAGLPDPPTRGRLTRTLALLNAALKVWETNQPRRAAAWRDKRADSSSANSDFRSSRLRQSAE